MTREDAVTYLTSLEGRVSMVVQYKREGQRKNILYFVFVWWVGSKWKLKLVFLLKDFILKL